VFCYEGPTLNHPVLKAALLASALALGACAMLPGGGAIKVTLSGAEEVPPAKTAAAGSGSFRVAQDGAITGGVTTSGMRGTRADIHLGEKGKTGPVILPLAKKGDTYTVPEGRKLSEAQRKALKEGRLYVNVRSARFRNGEIRAQLQP
jgi:CHRD domain-containing protein